MKTSLKVIVLVMVVGIFWFFGKQYIGKLGTPNVATTTPSSNSVKTSSTTPMDVKVSYTPNQGNKVVPPKGLPTGIPYEKNNLVSSSVTNYEGQKTVQYALAFTTSKKVSDEEALYHKYMTGAGYEVKKGGNDTVIALMGKKTDSSLTVVISAKATSTTVQLSYLSFGQ